MNTDETATIDGLEDAPQAPQEPTSQESTTAPAPAAPDPLLAARRPRNARGWYIVLAAKVTASEPPRYRELGWTKAHSVDQAKRIALACPIHGPRLKKTARDGGVLIRPVAAPNWPKVDPTKVETTESLVIG